MDSLDFSKWFLLFLGTLLSTVGSAQGHLLDVVNNFNNSKIWDGKAEGVEGSPFFVDRWIDADVTTKLGSTFERIPVKYNGLSDEIYFKDENGKVLVFNSDIIERFEFRDNEKDITYVFRHIPFQGFMLVLHDAETSLLKSVRKKIRKGQESNGYNTNKTNDKIYDIETLYVEIGEKGRIFPISSRKSFVEALNSSKMESYMKKEKLRMKFIDDLVLALKYYDSLKSK